MTRPALARMCPFFIVGNVPRAIAFYRDRLAIASPDLGRVALVGWSWPSYREGQVHGGGS